MSPGVMRSSRASICVAIAADFDQPVPPKPLLRAVPVQHAAVILRAERLDGLAAR